MRRAALILLGLVTVGFAERHVQAAEPPAASAPADADSLARLVVAAMRDHDQAAMERLVNWEGVRPFRRRMTLHQISTGFGRPIKSAVVEDLPADALDEAQSHGTLKPNMTVTKALKVVFDEPADEFGGAPSNVYLVGEKDGALRIAVLTSTGSGRK